MSGKVILVGAGPGSAGLMTLRGKQALETADVVLFDRLVGEEVLAMIPESVTKTDVGKSSGRHPIAQKKINALLLEHVKEGKTVVRLKGGDPYLFGRGAEELEAVISEDIPFEVVPGVTSATAVPSYAGIPVSHREFSSSVHIITAHRQNGEAPDIDYQSIVSFGGTLVFLMGIGTIEKVTWELIKAGMPGGTPAALIENGTRADQRKLVSSLSEISRQGKSEEFKPPSILVIGEVCSLSEKLDWYSRLPLRGIKIIVTRPAARNSLSQKLRELGADVINFPCILTEKLVIPDSLFKELALFNWLVFTSPTGAEIFFDELQTNRFDIRALHSVKIAAIGEKTAQVFNAQGINVDYVPDKFNAKELGTDLPYNKKNGVLLFRAENGTPQLTAALRERGFTVTDVPAYRTVCAGEDVGPVPANKALQIGEADYVAFTSASTVRGFSAATYDIRFDRSGLTAICIGEETAAEARKHDFKTVISNQATIESMIEKIVGEIGR